eukprot:5090423-Pleurochrysis_carterae.AAC.3
MARVLRSRGGGGGTRCSQPHSPICLRRRAAWTAAATDRSSHRRCRKRTFPPIPSATAGPCPRHRCRPSPCPRPDAFLPPESAARCRPCRETWPQSSCGSAGCPCAPPLAQAPSPPACPPPFASAAEKRTSQTRAWCVRGLPTRACLYPPRCRRVLGLVDIRSARFGLKQVRLRESELLRVGATALNAASRAWTSCATA